MKALSNAGSQTVNKYYVHNEKYWKNTMKNAGYITRRKG